MIRVFVFLLLYTNLHITTTAQVKPEYIYNTGMPYGTLDIRTRISGTDYYYLLEGKTFSYRENPSGVRTYSYLNMTTWDTSPYREGHMRHKAGTKDDFVINYRLLLPLNYTPEHKAGYPLIVIMNGAGERGNCHYNNCYHSTPEYDPNVNAPPAPNNADHKLLNNDHHVSIGGKEHLAARNLAGTRLPDDPSMPERAFAGFVLMPQMLNVWDSLNVEDVIRLVRLHCESYAIDQNRIYIHGLSIGGYATYEAIKRAPWLFAAALPMSAVREAANIFVHQQQSKVSHIPLWIFQGGQDINPTPEFTESVISKFKEAGAVVKYTIYPTVGHGIWNRAYNEPAFFSWMRGYSKTNIHIHKDVRVIEKDKNIFPILILAEGFLAYQWEKDGSLLSAAKSNTLTVTEPGTYKARFSRISSTPTDSEWNFWSASVIVTEKTSNNEEEEEENEEEEEEEGEGSEEEEEVVTDIPTEKVLTISIYPNPSASKNLQIEINGSPGSPVHLTLLDPLGRQLYSVAYPPVNPQPFSVPPLSDGVYMVVIRQGDTQLKKRVVIKN